MTQLNIEETGVKDYLEQTKEKHNNRGYNEFVKYVKLLGTNQDGFTRITKSGLARHYNVTRPTLERWLKQYEIEQAIK